MLQAARGYVTWGEPSEEIIAALVQKRGKLSGNKKLTEEHIEKAGYKSMAELAKAIFNCHVEYWKLPSIQVVFKLRPPSKGYKGNIKKGFRGGGELGYRGEKINELLKRMI
jgi:large subunit ribosomal protein L30